MVGALAWPAAPEDCEVAALWALEQAGYHVVVQAWDFGPGSNYVGFEKYSGFSPYGYSGGLYYLRLTYRFDS